jgi:hypothetical protein
VGDSREKVIGQLESRWDLRPDEATYATWLKSGLSRTIIVPATARPGFVKVVVYDRQSDRLGSKSVKLR